MTSAAQRSVIPFSEFDVIREAREVLRHEADALISVSDQLDASFCAAVRLIVESTGSVIVTGVGKAGLIGKKLVATLSSTGTRAHFLHPTEAVHGDLGCVHTNDVVLAISNSGETDELCRLLPIFHRMKIPIIALTSHAENTLAQNSNVVLQLGNLVEAGQLKLAPSTSTTAMLGLGDALALTISRLRRFTAKDFAVFHPGGSLGNKLRTVNDVMRAPEELRLARRTETIRDVLIRLSLPGRRTGAVLIVDDDGRLAGLFTDSDLARLLERRRDGQLDRPIGDSMTAQPVTITACRMIGEAVELLSDRKLSELPVVDDAGRPIGMIDITDLIGMADTTALQPDVAQPRLKVSSEPPPTGA